MSKNSGFLISFSLAVAVTAAACTAPASKDAPAARGVMPVEQASAAGVPAKIAYVNIDTLEAKYELLKSKREDFKKRQEQMENELQRSFDQMNQDAEEVRKKAQANTLTQVEYEAAEKRLGQMQHSLETRKQSLQEQLLKEQEDFNKDLKTKLDAFLEEYNKAKHYDYVLSYSYSGSSLLYVNKQLEITRDVVDGLNAAAKNDAGKKN